MMSRDDMNNDEVANWDYRWGCRLSSDADALPRPAPIPPPHLHHNHHHNIPSTSKPELPQKLNRPAMKLSSAHRLRPAETLGVKQ